MKLSRRDLLRRSALLSAAAGVGWRPRDALAATGDRKFLFFFASGGWDTTTVFDPKLSDDVDLDPDTGPIDAGGLTFTGGEGRENVERFFGRWGARSAIINGIDAHSVGHDSARQFVMTGTSASSYADWPTIIASNATGDYPLPHLVFSGPSYAGSNGSAVVRAGGGTLIDLIDASILGRADAPAPQLLSPSDSMVDAFVHGRTTEWARELEGVGRERAEGMLAGLERSMELEARSFEAGLGDTGNSTLDQAILAVEAMRLGLCRCAMIGIPGGWDSHGNNTVQGPQLEDFFAVLDELMDHMRSTPGHSTRWLSDEVVIVAMSEIGRTPLLNASGGKDHWPYTSALVVGSGVAGGRVIGGTDQGLIAREVDRVTGQVVDSGELLSCAAVGLGLLQLAGLDPERFLPGIEPLSALVG